MTNDLMREAFEAWAKERSFNLHRSLIVAGDYSGTRTKAAWAAWQAAYAAGMERAAGIVDGLNDSAGDASSYDGRDMYPGEQERMQAISACADAIRAEIPASRNWRRLSSSNKCKTQQHASSN